MTRIKPNSWEHYLHLLNTHNFDLDVTDSGLKSWMIDKHEENERLIQKLRLIYDERGTMYNQYNPKK